MLRDFFGNIPAITKNLLILNIIVFVFIITGESNGYSFERNKILGLYYFESPAFHPYQIITHMFAHGGFGHLLFNMLSMVMFGSVLERLWGPKRFLIFYLITGFGSAFLHSLVNYIQFQHITSGLSNVEVDTILKSGGELMQQGMVYADPTYKLLQSILYVPAVGASGAIFGLIVGFAVLFPNTELMIIFFPIPIKAKYLVPFFVVAEFALGIGNFEFDNIAHFAHLGGALFGFILVKIWQKDKRKFY